MSYQFTFINSETFPVQVISGFSAGAAIATGALGMNYAENPYFRTSFCSGVTSMNRTTLRGQVNVPDIFGTKQGYYDDTFTGSTTSSTLPTASTVSLYAGTGSGGIPYTAAGVTVGGWVSLLVQFFRRNNLTT